MAGELYEPLASLWTAVEVQPEATVAVKTEELPLPPRETLDLPVYCVYCGLQEPCLMCHETLEPVQYCRQCGDLKPCSFDRVFMPTATEPPREIKFLRSLMTDPVTPELCQAAELHLQRMWLTICETSLLLSDLYQNCYSW